MSEIKIRRATKDDIAILLPLIHDYWSFEGIHHFQQDLVTQQLLRLFNESHLGSCWLSLANNVAVGYLLAVYVFSLENLGLTAEIDELFILPQYRGKGVGKALLQTAELEFLQIGCTSISLQVARGNEPARSFYHRNGYIDRSHFELLEKEI
jgi:ribosomal protein S18 acetylase RimI-like enzyme